MKEGGVAGKEGRRKGGGREETVKDFLIVDLRKQKKKDCPELQVLLREQVRTQTRRTCSICNG